jgi:hypothetical protein
VNNEKTNEECNMNIPLSELSGSGATRELHESIKTFNETATKQAESMIRLTKAIMWLTVVMLLAAIAQVGVVVLNR